MIARLTELERQIVALLEQAEPPKDFHLHLQHLVGERHQLLKQILAEPDLSREAFKQVQQQTTALKVLLEQHREKIRQKLLAAKKAQKSVSAYQMYQK